MPPVWGIYFNFIFFVLLLSESLQQVLKQWRIKMFRKKITHSPPTTKIKIKMRQTDRQTDRDGA